MSKPAAIIPKQSTITVAKTPAMVGIYGPPKLGKTTDIIYSSPRTFFFARAAALKPSATVVGIDLHPSQIWYTNRVKQMAEYLPKVAATGQFDSAAIDDFSVAVEETYLQIKDGYKGSNNYAPWTMVRQEVLDLVNVARDCGLHVFFNMHVNPPKTKNGHTMKGGPKLPTDLQEMFPALLDTVLYAVPAPGRMGWPVAYRCSVLDPMFLSGDRHGITPDMSPMNCGEILRGAGFQLRRWPGLEWLDDLSERICNYMLQTSNPQQEQEVLKGAIAWMRQHVTQNDLHIRWALRDGIDRCTLRRARSNILNTFFETQGAPQGGLVTV